DYSGKSEARLKDSAGLDKEEPAKMPVLQFSYPRVSGSQKKPFFCHQPRFGDASPSFLSLGEVDVT
ncbi:hypothetical protein NY536_07350, partial [Enterobacter hormaechei]|nr:hypothetical protein [Enterobacter hormaechei]